MLINPLLMNSVDERIHRVGCMQFQQLGVWTCTFQLACYIWLPPVATQTRSVMSVESANSAPDLTQRSAGSRKRSFAVGHGLSEVDIATRQRYFENSG